MIKISKKLKSLKEKITLGLLEAKVDVGESSEILRDLMYQEVKRIEDHFTINNYRTETLEASRNVYKALGKDPSRYRISSDALIRRVINKKGIYFVNNIVDINNLISLKTLWSIGAYDLDKIKGSIQYDVGGDDLYIGIGRGEINIKSLPVLKDDLGPFGSATSDSVRTMVTETSTSILMVVHGFGEGIDMASTLNEMATLLKVYANATEINISILE